MNGAYGSLISPDHDEGSVISPSDEPDGDGLDHDDIVEKDVSDYDDYLDYHDHDHHG